MKYEVLTTHINPSIFANIYGQKSKWVSHELSHGSKRQPDKELKCVLCHTQNNVASGLHWIWRCLWLVLINTCRTQRQHYIEKKYLNRKSGNEWCVANKPVASESRMDIGLVLKCKMAISAMSSRSSMRQPTSRHFSSPVRDRHQCEPWGHTDYTQRS